MASESAAFRGDDRNGPTFEWRASTAFKVVVAFAAVIEAILIAGTRQLPPVYLVLAIVASVGCLIATARGLDVSEGWALAAAPALLWILVGFGIIQVVIALAASRIEFPIGAILAVWAFRAPRSLPAGPADGRRVVAVVGTFLAANAVSVLGPPLLGPAGPFAAGEGDIQVSLVVDCGPPSAGVPETVPVTFRWSWDHDEPFPGGVDGIAIAWRSEDTTAPDGGPGDPDAQDAGHLFILADPPPALEEGVWPGGAAPSSEQTEALVYAFGNGTTFGVDLAVQQFRPGQIALTLDRSAAGPVSHGYLEVRAEYDHLGRWRVQPDLMSACQW